MKYSNAFGKKSSKILLGTAYFGETIDEKQSFNLLDTYIHLGGCHIDTARLYADGQSEIIVGKWLKSQKRDEIFLSTKGAFPKKEQPDVPRLSAEEIRSDIEESLVALNQDYVDFYWLHRDDEKREAGEIIETLNELFKEGKMKAFGASNWRHERIEEANAYAKNHSLEPFYASQVRMSPAVLTVGGDDDRGLVNMTKEGFLYYKSKKTMPVCAYASQAKGFFSKMIALGEEGLSEKSKKRYLCPENLEILKVVKELCQKYGASPASIVCAALCSIEDFEVFPIIGPGRTDQLEDSLKNADITLEREEISRIFERFGAGKNA